jgi:hypothetical protein
LRLYSNRRDLCVFSLEHRDRQGHVGSGRPTGIGECDAGSAATRQAGAPCGGLTSSQQHAITTGGGTTPIAFQGGRVNQTSFTTTPQLAKTEGTDEEGTHADQELQDRGPTAGAYPRLQMGGSATLEEDGGATMKGPNWLEGGE